MEFEGQIAVVTGAAKGLGRSISELLAAGGATVYMVDIDRETLTRSHADLRGLGHAVEMAVVDLADEPQLAALRDRIAKEHGRLEILINNAGGWRYGGARDITIEDWDWTFRTNVTCTFLATRALMDLMTARHYGRIVNIASTDAYRAKLNLPHYAAAKAAVISLTRSLGAELGPHEVLVNGVSPGPIATETAKSQGWLQERIKTIPVGRVAEPADIAEVVLFLASRRNRFMVGETVLANGGSLMA